MLTGVIIAAIGTYLLTSPKTRPSVFCHRGRVSFFIFILYTVVVALAHKNYLGIACSLGFFLIVTISYYVRSVITKRVFEHGLDICCYCAIPIGIAAIIEKVINSADDSYRCKLWFFNENYFCTIMAAVIIICAFRATSYKKSVVIYYVCAFFAAISMYLGESIFAFVNLFVGICVMLVLRHKHLTLAAFLLMVCFCLVIIYCVPDLFPRLAESNITTDRRIRIWNEAMTFIKENPLFGRGFLSYHQITSAAQGVYKTQHAHNFALEPLVSFGIIGSLLLIGFIWSYYGKVAECKELLRKNCATSLILALSAGMMIHMTTDMTILWIQTGLLFGLILGGIGVDEKALNKRINACANKNSSKTEE